MNDFEKGFRKASRRVAQTVHPKLTLSTDSVKLLSQLLSNFNDVLVEECRNSFKSSKGDSMMREELAQNAVEKLMKGQLKNLAIANAHKTLALHSAGLLAYTPKAIQDAKKKQKGKMPDEFAKSVAPLCKLVSSDVKLKKDAKDAIAQFIFQMNKSIIEKAQSLVAEVAGELTVDEIIKAVDFYLKPNMAKHARSEGAKNARNFMSGTHYYTEDDFAAKTS